MDTAHRHPFLRPGNLNTYTAYSIGCIIAWAVVWTLVLTIDPKKDLGYVLLIFIGWIIGWTSATIARVMYPPPKRWRPVAPTSGAEG